MRPDQHKQKRSAQYKKKHGIAGKSQDGKKRESSAESGAAGPGLSEDDGSMPPVTNEEDKSFSRRKLLNNWDRYNDISDESDDEEEGQNVASVKKRGEDFTTLVEKAANPESQFRFRAEQEWEDTGNEGNQLAASSTLQINFGELAICLQSIPLHERLGIKDTQIHPDILNQFQSGTGIPSGTEPCTQQQSSKTAASGNQHAGRLTEKTLPQKKDLQKSVEQNTSVRVSEKGPGTRCQERNPASAQKGSGLRMSLKEVLKTTSNVQESDQREKEESQICNIKEDDELDFLLSLSTPTEQSQPQDQGNYALAQQEKISSSTTNKQTTQSHQSKGQSKKQTLPAKEEGDDLEDWLDSVLG